MKLYFPLHQVFENTIVLLLFLCCGLISLSLSLSPSLSQISLSLFFVPRWYILFFRFRLRMAFVVYPILKCSWPFTPDLSSHFLVIFLPLTFADAHFIFILYLLHFCIPLLEYILLYLFSYHCSVYHFC